MNYLVWSESLLLLLYPNQLALIIFCLHFCVSGENKFLSAFGQQNICHNAQIGISIEPEANIQLLSSSVVSPVHLYSTNTWLNRLGCYLIFAIYFVIGTASKLLHLFCSKDVREFSKLCCIILSDPGPDDTDAICLIHPSQHAPHLVPELWEATPAKP